MKNIIEKVKNTTVRQRTVLGFTAVVLSGGILVLDENQDTNIAVAKNNQEQVSKEKPLKEAKSEKVEVDKKVQSKIKT